MPRSKRGHSELTPSGVFWTPGPVGSDTAIQDAADGQSERRGTGLYGPENRSWFADLLAVADHEARAAAALQSPILKGQDQGPLTPPPASRRGAEHGLDAVRRRLQTARELAATERRDLTSAFDVSGAPIHVNNAFATSARAQGTIFAALNVQPLPDHGEAIKIPRITTGASVGIQSSENSAVSETDPATDVASANVALVAGQVDESRQLFERTVPAFDAVMSAELGKAIAAAVDVQLLYGTNANLQTQGLATLTGRIQVSYTDASPTPAEALSKVLSAYSQLATPTGGYGVARPADYVVILHPRRLAWFLTDDATRRILLDNFGLIVPSAAVTTTAGAGTNQDELFIVARSEATVYAGPTEISIYPEVGSSTLTVRVQARRFVAGVFRSPNAIAHITGSGLIAPSL